MQVSEVVRSATSRIVLLSMFLHRFTDGLNPDGMLEFYEHINGGTSKTSYSNLETPAKIHRCRLGGHVDMTIGPHWPTGFPGYTPDSPSTSKELVHGQVFIQAGATFSGMLPLPLAAPSGNETGNPNVMATPYLATVLVAKTSTTNESASVVDFNPSSVQVITNLVKDNNSITWTAPSDGTYVLVAAYGRGTGQIQNMYDGKVSRMPLSMIWRSTKQYRQSYWAKTDVAMACIHSRPL